MQKWYRKGFRRGAIVGASLMIASCGGGASDDGGNDPDVPDNDDGDSPSSLIVPPDVLPATSSEGAEPGLRGCLNRPLYYNGPHFVSTIYDVTHSGSTGSSGNSEQIEQIYTVTEIETDGVAHVDMETTLTTSMSTGVSFTTPYTLDGYTVGPSSASDNNAQVINYDLAIGESVTQTLGMETGGSEGSTRTYTYVGRETLTFDGQQIETCRVDSETRNETELPQFRLISDVTDWYGVGTGLKLRTEGVSYPDSEQGSVTTVKVLTFGSINAESVL